MTGNDSDIGAMVEFIGLLPENFADKLLELLTKFRPWLLVARSLPDELGEPIASMFLHGIVTIIKEVSQDSKRHREIALKWTIRVFHLDRAWEPTWVMLPYQPKAGP